MSEKSEKQEFDVTLFKDEGSTGVGFVVPFNVKKIYGTDEPVKVRGTIDGHPYRGSIAPHSGKHYMVIRRDVREAIAKTGGDTIHVVMERDLTEQTVMLPQDFKEALVKDPVVKAAFDKLSHADQQAWVEWIDGAKKAQTRASRISKAVQKISSGVERPS